MKEQTNNPGLYLMTTLNQKTKFKQDTPQNLQLSPGQLFRCGFTSTDRIWLHDSSQRTHFPLAEATDDVKKCYSKLLKQKAYRCAIDVAGDLLCTI